MFHRELYEAIDTSLHQSHGPSTPITMLDLGCGDSTQIAAILQHHHVLHYYGCDLASSALDVARTNLSVLKDVKVTLSCQDMLEALKSSPEGQYNVVFTSYALHHLSTKEKEEFFHQCRRVLCPGGWLSVYNTIHLVYSLFIVPLLFTNVFS